MTVYVFGVLNDGYTQYLNDSSSKIFKKIYNNSNAPTQIAIHRDGNLMYYCYIRKLTEDKYIGLAVALSNVYLIKIDKLFSFFEHIIEEMANRGTIIHFTNEGELSTSIGKLYEQNEEVDILSDLLRNNFSQLETKPLPVEDFSIAKDSIGIFSADEINVNMLSVSYKFSYTIIYKSNDYNTIRMNSYKGVLCHLTEDNNKLKEHNKELQEQNKKILREKKQFRNVIILILIVIGCCIGMNSLYKNLNSTNLELNMAKDSINNLRDTIDFKNLIIQNKIDEIKAKKKRIKRLTENYDKKVEELEIVNEKITQIENYQPFLFRYMIFNYKTGYLSLRYFGLKEETCSIKIKILSKYGWRTYDKKIHIESGYNETFIYIDNHLSRDFNYTFFIIYNNIVIGGSY